MSITIRTILALSTLLLAAPARAQAPHIRTLFPPGIRRGAAGTITLAGDNLKPDSRVVLSGEGVTARATAATAGEKPGEGSLTLQVHVAPDALPGVRELRVLGPDGVSNAARLVVGTLPEMLETEPNNAPAEAQALPAGPVTVYGRIDPVGDVDTFRFHAGAGETWVFDLGSVSHDSRLDGALSLRDAAGQEIAATIEALDRDPRLIHSFTTAGDYTIAVRDVEYHGMPEATYALSVGRLPTVTTVLPLALPRGETTTLQLAGVNLGGMASMQVSVPAHYTEDTMTVVPETPAGAAAPVRLAVSGLPEWVEKEPNDDRPHATRLPALPGAVSGVIDRAGDVDVYVFHAAAGQKLRCDLLARRLGSRLDSFLRLTDAAGKELASNDDAAGKDSRLDWTAPAAGDFFVQVADIAGEGGAGYGYRLEITAPPGPDFKLSVTPDALNLGQGGTGVLTVRAERLNGFTGDVALRVEPLPPGITASPATLHFTADSKEEASIPITLSAPADAPRDGFALRVIGTATVAGHLVEHAAQPLEAYQPPGEENSQERPALSQFAGVAAPPPFTLSLDPRTVTLAPGATAKLAVHLSRRPDPAAKGEAALDVQFVPEGLDVKAPAIPADKSDGEIELKATEKLPPGPVTLIVRARIKAMDKETDQPAPALALTVTPAKAKPENTKATKDAKDAK